MPGWRAREHQRRFLVAGLGLVAGPQERRQGRGTHPGGAALPALEDAPGSYVKVRAAD